jgi:hypothetical protein
MEWVDEEQMSNQHWHENTNKTMERSEWVDQVVKEREWIHSGGSDEILDTQRYWGFHLYWMKPGTGADYSYKDFPVSHILPHQVTESNAETRMPDWLWWLSWTNNLFIPIKIGLALSIYIRNEKWFLSTERVDDINFSFFFLFPYRRSPKAATSESPIIS